MDLDWPLTPVIHYHPSMIVCSYLQFVCFVTMMLAFTLGFYRMTGPESGIPCEMMLYFSYYRVGLFYGIWVAFCINETIAIVSRVSACLRQRQVHLLLTLIDGRHFHLG